MQTHQNRNLPSGLQNRPTTGDDMDRVMVNPSIDGDLYRLFVPAIAVGSNKVFFDLFNGTDDKIIQIASVVPVVSGAVAVTGALAVDLFLTRTTAVGTGGTAATLEGTALTAATISKLNPYGAALPATVTARNSPAGGAAAGAVISGSSVFTEETNAATYTREDMLHRMVGNSANLVVAPATGIRVVQGAVASVGNIGFDVFFSLRSR